MPNLLSFFLKLLGTNCRITCLHVNDGLPMRWAVPLSDTHLQLGFTVSCCHVYGTTFGNNFDPFPLLTASGACYHALGMHRQAVEHYQSTMDVDAAGLSPETVSNMCLAFYQKEMALWCRAHLDDPVEKLCLDADLHPEFKVRWARCMGTR